MRRLSHRTTREVPRDGLLKRVVKKTTSLRRKSEHKDSHEGASRDDTWGKNVPGEGTASGDGLRQTVTSKGDEAAGVGPVGEDVVIEMVLHRRGKKTSHLLYHMRLMYGKLLFLFLVQALFISVYSCNNIKLEQSSYT